MMAARSSGTGLIESTFFRQERMAPHDLDAQLHAVLHSEAARLRAQPKQQKRVAPKRRAPSNIAELTSYSSLTEDEAEVYAAYCALQLSEELVTACGDGDEQSVRDLLADCDVRVHKTNSDPLMLSHML